MSGPGSSSLPPRPPAGTEPVTRIDRPQTAPDQQAPPQGSGASSPAPPAPDLPADSPHHDPAVSLAASFARLDRGALVAGLIAGLSPEGDPLLQSPSGSYVIETTSTASKALLAALVTAEAATLEIIATERVIEARVLTIDGKPPQGLSPETAAAPLKLILIKPPEITPTGTLSARPDTTAPTYRPPVILPQTGAESNPEMPSEAASPWPLLTRSPASVLPQGPVLQAPSLQPPAASPTTSTSTPVQAPQPQTASQTVLMPTGPATPLITAPMDRPAAPASVPNAPLEAANPLPLGRPLPALLESLPAVHVTGDSKTPNTSPPAEPPRPAVVMLERLVATTPLPASPPAAITPSSSPLNHLEGEILPPAPQTTVTATPPPTRIATPAGIVTLADPLPLPPGSRVMLSLTVVEHRAPLAGIEGIAELEHAFAPTARPLMRSLPLEAMAPAVPQSAPGQIPAPRPLDNWPSLETAMATLASTDPSLAASLLAKLPSPERLMTPVTLLFLTALGLRSPARLIFGREGIQRLEAQGRGDLLRLIESEIGKPLQSTPEQASDWRSLLLPLRTPDGIQAIPLVVRQTGGNPDPSDKDGKQQDKGQKDDRVTRFLLDLRLTATGQLQFDGMIRDRTFNLILRSERDLPQSAASHIRGLFRTALEGSGFTGDILLRTEPPVAVQVAGPLNNLKA